MAADASQFRLLLGSLGNALSWWTSELSAMFPQAASWISGKNQRTVLRLGSGTTVVRRLDSRGEGGQDLASWTLELWELGEADAGELKALCAGSPVSVQLGEPLVLRVTTRVPGAGGATREAVGYALLRDSPLAPEHMEFDWRLAKPSDGDDAWRGVDVVVCESSTLERIDQALSGWGIAADGVTVPNPLRPGSEPLRLRRRAGRVGHLSAAHARAALMASVLVLMVAAPLAAGLLAKLETAKTNEQLTQLTKDRAVQEPVLRRLAATRTLRDALAPSLGKAGALATLNEVAYRLDDNSWVEEFMVEGEQLKIGGRSTDPGRAVRELATSPRLRDVLLESSNTAASPDGKAGFRIVARLRGEP